MDLKIKIFGERNTGTRAIKQMLRAVDGVNLHLGERVEPFTNVEWANLNAGINLYYRCEYRKFYLDALRDNTMHDQAPLLMWKHAAPLWDDQFHRLGVNTVFAVRNPYSWVLSMARKPYHMKAGRTGDFDTFISRPWLTERRDNTDIILPSVLDLWNKKIHAYADFAAQAARRTTGCCFVRFEDFVADPSALLSRVLDNFGYSDAQVQAIKSSTKNRGKPLKELQDYYACEAWKRRLTASNVEKINGFLDSDLLDLFHYPKLDPAHFPESLDPKEQKQFTYEMMNLDRKAEFEVVEKRA